MESLKIDDSFHLKNETDAIDIFYKDLMAERVGFEPTIRY